MRPRALIAANRRARRANIGYDDAGEAGRVEAAGDEIGLELRVGGNAVRPDRFPERVALHLPRAKRHVAPAPGMLQLVGALQSERSGALSRFGLGVALWVAVTSWHPASAGLAPKEREGKSCNGKHNDTHPQSLKHVPLSRLAWRRNSFWQRDCCTATFISRVVMRFFVDFGGIDAPGRKACNRLERARAPDDGRLSGRSFFVRSRQWYRFKLDDKDFAPLPRRPRCPLPRRTARTRARSRSGPCGSAQATISTC